MKRKSFLFLAIVILILTMFVGMFDISANAEKTKIGDVNGDYVVDSDDAIYLLRHTLKPLSYPITQPSDFDENGRVDSDDAIYLLRYTLSPEKYPITSPCIAAEAVIENKVDSTCTETGSYDEVVYCSVCGDELSRITRTIEKKAHTGGTPITENFVDSTCKDTGSCEEVIYCSGCGCELSRVKKTIEMKTTHAEVVDAMVTPTCTATGLTEGKHCSVCNAVLVEQTVIPAKEHTASETVVENNVNPDCTNAGSYDNVIYCTACDTEISRETVIADALGHDEIEHNAQAPTCVGIGWDEYITCSRCVYTTYVEKAALGHKKSGTCITCGYTVISTAAELKNISSKLDGKYILMNNINLGGAEWMPIGNYSSSFKGIFDGNGYVISNFAITSSSRVGLFTDNDGTIQNLGLTSFTIKVNSGGCAGGLVAVNKGSLINCYATGKVSISTSDYYAYSDFTSGDYAGGLVGSNTGTITNCYATGSVSLSSHGTGCYGYIGGLVGANSGTITNCYETASVSSGARHINYAGGLVGYNDGGSITQCYAAGSVSSNSSSSSKSGFISDNTGGLVGYNVKGTITNCYANGVVSSRANNYNSVANGGLVGNNYSGTIACCYATGSVSSVFGSDFGSSYSGGLVGRNSGNIKNCYGVGNVMGSSSNASKYTVNPFYAGGLVGSNSGTTANCYRYSGQQITLKNDGTTVYGNTNENGTAKGMYELQSSSFYTDTIDWSTDIWTFVEGEYPTLKKAKSIIILNYG